MKITLKPYWAEINMSVHKPVMLKESMESLNIKREGTYVDMTFGRGGHTKEIIKNLISGTVIAFDLDDDAISSAEAIKAPPTIAFQVIKGNFKDIKVNLETQRITKVDGILLDLGVSSPQFDTPERGFSYRYDAPLDMRMDQDQRLTAADIVNTYPPKELYRIFRDYGEEKFAKPIAREIETQRAIKIITTTGELVELVKKVLPKKVLLKDKHPAKQIFQALRIETNRELENLKIALKNSANLLKPSGRLVVITYHSLEDRIVKQFFRELTVVQGNRLNIPTSPDEGKTEYELLYRKSIKPSNEELNENPRAHSAKLRVLVRKTN